jgi:hypothetical protein
VIVPRPKPTSAAPILLADVPELVTVALIDKTYAALLRGTAFMMIGPLSAVVAEEKALRFDLTAVNS